MIRRLAMAVVCVTAILMTELTIAPVAAEPGPVIRVSRDVDGGDPNGKSDDPSISHGRYVAFDSLASNLVPDDGNLRKDVFVRDMRTGVTTRVSVDTAGGNANGASHEVSISGSGRHVAFASQASDLVPGDANLAQDVFVRDMVTGTTTRVSVDSAGGDANSTSRLPSISIDGRYVAFMSAASDLVTGDGNGNDDVFVRDLVAGTTTRVSVAADGGDSEGGILIHSPSVSRHGRYVAFDSFASDLVAGDSNGVPDVFVRDLVAGTTTRASVDVDGGDPDNHSYSPSISADGRLVAFTSRATDLSPGDGEPNYANVFVRDLTAGTTEMVSVNAEGDEADSSSGSPSLSGDGRYVAFDSLAQDLVPDNVSGWVNVFVRDLVSDTTAVVNVRPDGTPTGARSQLPSISYNGTYVAFASLDSGLVAGDTNGVMDIFRRRML